MRDAPSAVKGSVGESSQAASVSDADLEKQLAKLKALWNYISSVILWISMYNMYTRTHGGPPCIYLTSQT